MNWDPVWEEIFRKYEWGKYPGEDLIRFVARNFYKVPKRSDIRILEVGCGPGANLWYMAREGFGIYGIDGSSTAIEIAKKRLDIECSGWQGNLLVGDIGTIPYPDNFFDAVIDNEAICCNSFEASKLIYKEVSRTLKIGGKLFSRTFASGTWGDGVGEPVGRNAWLVAEGPLEGKGFNRFTSREDIPELLPCSLHVLEVELLTRTMNSGLKQIKEWLITAEKDR